MEAEGIPSVEIVLEGEDTVFFSLLVRRCWVLFFSMPV